MLSVFLPIRKNSQRVPNKNVKNFAGVEGGLTKIKLDQLINVSNIDKIILSTDCEIAISIAKKINSNKVFIDNRPEEFCRSDTTTDDLIEYVNTIVKKGTILWTHVTSPFINEKTYYNAIDFFLKNKNKYDSLMSVSYLKNFFWKENKPLNYKREILKWPHTQNIEPIIEINNGIFITEKEVYEKLNDRIGTNPYLYETNKIQSFDIDWPQDFNIAEKIYIDSVKN